MTTDDGEESKKTLSGIATKSFMKGLGGAGIGMAAMAAATVVFSGGTPFPPSFVQQFGDLIKMNPLSPEDIARVVDRMTEKELSRRNLSEEQLAAARAHIEAHLMEEPPADLDAITNHDEDTGARGIRNRLRKIIASPEFTQLMTEHSVLWREQQSRQQGQDVAAAIRGGAQGQAKAPPRASFRKARQTVPA